MVIQLENCNYLISSRSVIYPTHIVLPQLYRYTLTTLITSYPLTFSKSKLITTNPLSFCPIPLNAVQICYQMAGFYDVIIIHVLNWVYANLFSYILSKSILSTFLVRILKMLNFFNTVLCNFKHIDPLRESTKNAIL